MPRVIAGARWLSVALGIALMPSLASAVPHTGLKRSEPAQGSRLPVSPTRIALWFTARPQLPFSRMRLTGVAGEIPLGALVADTGNALRAELQRPLVPGEYTVHWQTGSADGHVIRGEFAFVVVGGTTETPMVAPPTAAPATVAPETVQPTPATPEVGQPGYSEYRTARWLEFVALLTVLGALGFRHAVLPPLAARNVATADAADRARRLGQNALVLYAIAAVVRLYTEAVAMLGPGAFDGAQLLPMITGTTWGIGWLFGSIGALLLFVGWRISTRNVTIGTPLALTGAFGMVFSPALSGHAAVSRHFILSVVFDVLHVAAAGLWLGGLLMVLIAGIPAMKRLANGNQDAAVSALVNSFHPLALFCAPLVVVAGLGTSWIRLGSFSTLWPTPYGRTLLLKLALVSLVVGMGVYNSARARRRLGAAEGTRHIRRSGTTELLFAALVLAVTTVLVTTPVPSEIVVP